MKGRRGWRESGYHRTVRDGRTALGLVRGCGVSGSSAAGSSAAGAAVSSTFRSSTERTLVVPSRVPGGAGRVFFPEVAAAFEEAGGMGSSGCTARAAFFAAIGRIARAGAFVGLGSGAESAISPGIAPRAPPLTLDRPGRVGGDSVAPGIAPRAPPLMIDPAR
jgi:hypothetical protein